MQMGLCGLEVVRFLLVPHGSDVFTQDAGKQSLLVAQVLQARAPGDFQSKVVVTY